MPYKPVESFRITPQMSGWLKEYKKMQIIGKALKEGTMSARREAQSIQQMTQQYEQGMQLLFQHLPETKTHQVEDVT